MRLLEMHFIERRTRPTQESVLRENCARQVSQRDLCSFPVLELRQHVLTLHPVHLVLL